MPVRSLNSLVFKWPDAAAVDQALRRWAEVIAGRRPELLRVGYFGSYARGDWGVGSDLDVILIVVRSAQPFERRAVECDTTALPVPVDTLVYTQAEWKSLKEQGQGRFYHTVMREAIWVYVRADEEVSDG